MAHSIKKNLANAYAVSGGDANFETGSLKDMSIASIQIVWAGLDAVDGVVSFTQSHDETNYDSMSLTKTLDSASGSHTLADTVFSGEYARAELVVNSNTAGTVTINLIAKAR